MKKKSYEVPIVKKVKLDIRNAVLVVCFSSTVGSEMSPTCKDPNYTLCYDR